MFSSLSSSTSLNLGMLFLVLLMCFSPFPIKDKTAHNRKPREKCKPKFPFLFHNVHSSKYVCRSVNHSSSSHLSHKIFWKEELENSISFFLTHFASVLHLQQNRTIQHLCYQRDMQGSLSDIF